MANILLCGRCAHFFQFLDPFFVDLFPHPSEGGSYQKWIDSAPHCQDGWGLQIRAFITDLSILFNSN